MTKYFDMKNEIKEEEIKEAGKMIKNGELVIFPTETVYGIGANGLDSNAVKNIFIAKGRAQDNPLILHVSDIDMIDDIATDINEIERKIIDIFFPGPLTIILKKKDIVPVLTQTAKISLFSKYLLFFYLFCKIYHNLKAEIVFSFIPSR